MAWRRAAARHVSEATWQTMRALGQHRDVGGEDGNAASLAACTEVPIDLEVAGADDDGVHLAHDEVLELALLPATSNSPACTFSV